MKTFIIYVKGHVESLNQASACMNSIKLGFDAELFEGTTPDTLSHYEEKYKFPLIENSRLAAFQKENKKRYLTKKSCFYNHVRIWEKSIELDSPVAFVEHDSHCIRAWDHKIFSEVLIMNVESAMTNSRGPIGPSELELSMYRSKLIKGIHSFNDAPTKYHRKNRMLGSAHNPGNGAYAVTPKGARRLLEAAKNGHDQGDLFVNTSNVKIDYVYPEYFTFKLPNLGLSHGI